MGNYSIENDFCPQQQKLRSCWGGVSAVAELDAPVWAEGLRGWSGVGRECHDDVAGVGDRQPTDRCVAAAELAVVFAADGEGDAVQLQELDAGDLDHPDGIRVELTTRLDGVQLVADDSVELVVASGEAATLGVARGDADADEAAAPLSHLFDDVRERFVCRSVELERLGVTVVEAVRHQHMSVVAAPEQIVQNVDR